MSTTTKQPESVTASTTVLFPGSTEEMLELVGKKIISPFKLYDTLNICSALLHKIVELGGKEILESKLEGSFIGIIYNEDGTFKGFSLELYPIMESALSAYETSTVEYALACFYSGKLQELVHDYNGPKESTINMMLKMTCSMIVKQEDITVESLMQRVEDILGKR